MTHYTVLIPQRDKATTIGQLLPDLEHALKKLVFPYEIICIDDASAAPAVNSLEQLLYEHPALRVLRFDQPRGTSAALSAGLSAARGDLILALHPEGRWAIPYLPHLIARLSQHDFVFAQREQSLAVGLRRRGRDAARVLAADTRLHETEELLWAARREAVVGAALARGSFRVLPALVARRGFRTCRLTLAPGLPPQGSAFRLGAVQRGLAGWFERRFEPHLALEMVREPLIPSHPPCDRATLPPVRFVPQAVFAPAQEHRDSA